MPRAQFRDTVLLEAPSGYVSVPPSGTASVWLYDVGTTNPISNPIYADNASATLLANPVVPDTYGYVNFWLDFERELDLVVQAAGTTRRLTVTADSAGGAGSQLLLGPGSAAAPSLSFTADPSTGLFNPAPHELHIATGGVDRWYVSSTGHFLGAADNSYDIGASGANRPRNIWVGSQVVAPNGSASLPGFTFAAAQTTGLFLGYASGYVGFATSGTESFMLGPNDVRLGMNASLGWTGTPDPVTANPDTFLVRDAANTLAQRNGTNAQTFRVYNTYTDGNNYERLSLFGLTGNALFIQTEAAGTGVARDLYLGAAGSATVHFKTSNIDRWQVGAATGHLLASTDNIYDIGASGANRPRYLYVASGVTSSQFTAAGSSGGVTITERDSANTYQWYGTSALGFGLYISALSTTAWRFTAAGHFLAGNDNASDIGANGANRPRNVYVATSVVAPQVQADTLALGSASPDTFLVRDAANTLAQRNGTNAQTLRLYNTYTDANNYERAAFAWSSNTFVLTTQNAGTGTARNMQVSPAGVLALGGNGTSQWTINTSGYVVANADNTYDIGQSAANRPRNVFVAGAVATGVKAGPPVDTDVVTPTDGMIRIDSTNNRAYFRVGGVWHYATLT